MQKSARGVGVEVGLSDGGLWIGGGGISRSEPTSRILVIQGAAA